MANVKMSRQTDIWEMKVTSNDGVNPVDNPQTDPGAKDGLSGTNETKTFQGNGDAASISVKKMGPFGGMDAD